MISNFVEDNMIPLADVKFNLFTNGFSDSLSRSLINFNYRNLLIKVIFVCFVIFDLLVFWLKIEIPCCEFKSFIFSSRSVDIVIVIKEVNSP